MGEQKDCLYSLRGKQKDNSLSGESSWKRKKNTKTVVELIANLGVWLLDKKPAVDKTLTLNVKLILDYLAHAVETSRVASLVEHKSMLDKKYTCI